MPPNGTPGLARSWVKGISRLPSPPARTIAGTFFAGMAQTLNVSGGLRQTNGIMVWSVRVDLLTREYPPDVYGGGGVHVEYLTRELRKLRTSPLDAALDVRVHCFGAPRSEAGVTGYPDPPGLAGANAALRTMGVDLEMAAGCAGTDLVHSHTWYANLAGHTAKLLHGVPHVVTTHSLEPLRPWKAEQLGGGY